MTIYATATIPLILMIIEIMYDQPGYNSKLVAFADDFIAARTLKQLEVLLNILYDLCASKI